MKNYKLECAETIANPRERKIEAQGNEIAGENLYYAIDGNMVGELLVDEIVLEEGKENKIGFGGEQFRRLRENERIRAQVKNIDAMER